MIHRIAPQGPADIYPYVYGSGVTGGPEDAPEATMAIDASGRHVVFLGGHPFSGGRAWIWVQQTDAGDWLYNDFGSGEDTFGGTGHMNRIRIVWDGTGSPSFYFVSPATHGGHNGDGSEEIWRATFD